MILKIEYMDRIRLDDELLLALAKANDVKSGTVRRWSTPGDRRGNRMLTTAENLSIIGKHFGILETADLLEEEEYAAGK